MARELVETISSDRVCVGNQHQTVLLPNQTREIHRRIMDTKLTGHDESRLDLVVRDLRAAHCLEQEVLE